MTRKPELMDAPNSIRTIEFYDCSSYERRLFFQEALERSGALIQDYRLAFGPKTVKFQVCLTLAYKRFVEKLHETPAWAFVNEATVNTGSL